MVSRKNLLRIKILSIPKPNELDPHFHQKFPPHLIFFVFYIYSEKSNHRLCNPPLTRWTDHLYVSKAARIAAQYPLYFNK